MKIPTLFTCANPAIRTHTFDNHMHRAGVSRLERGSNHGEPTPPTSAARCSSVCRSCCTMTPHPFGDYGETRGCRPQNDTGFFLETSYNGLHCAGEQLQRRADRAHSEDISMSRQSSQRRSRPAPGGRANGRTGGRESGRMGGRANGRTAGRANGGRANGRRGERPTGMRRARVPTTGDDVYGRRPRGKRLHSGRAVGWHARQGGCGDGRATQQSWLRVAGAGARRGSRGYG